MNGSSPYADNTSREEKHLDIWPKSAKEVITNRLRYDIYFTRLFTSLYLKMGFKFRDILGATLYYDITPADDARFVLTMKQDPATQVLRTKLDEAASLLEGLPGYYRRPGTFYARLSQKQLNNWNGDGRFTFFRPSRWSLKSITHICLALFTFLMVLFVVYTPLVIAIFLHERAFIARQLPISIRNSIQIYSLVRFDYLNCRLMWTYIVERPGAIFPLTIAYILVAFYPPWGCKYHERWFGELIPFINLGLELAMTFCMTVWVASEAFRRKRDTSSNADLEEQAETLGGGLKNPISEFHALARCTDTSRHMTMQISLLKSDINILHKVIRDVYSPRRKTTKNTITRQIVKKFLITCFSKLCVLSLTIIVYVVCCVAYYYNQFLFANTLAGAIWVVARQAQKVFSSAQSLKDMFELFSNTTADNIPSLVCLAIPLLIARWARYDLIANNWAFAVMTLVNVWMTITASHLFAPFMTRLAVR